MNNENLSFLICPTRHIHSHFETLSLEIYSSWRSIWQETFAELKMENSLVSDPYLDSDFATVICSQDQVISMSLFKEFSTRSPAFKEYSYFKKWGPHVQILQEEKRIFNCTYFCVASNWRKRTVQNSSIKQLNLTLLLKTFTNTHFRFMAATPRRDRNMHELLYKWGGVCVQENVPSGYGDTVDLVLYIKEKVEEALQRQSTPLVEHLWENRTVIPFDSTNYNNMPFSTTHADVILKKAS